MRSKGLLRSLSILLTVIMTVNTFPTAAIAEAMSEFQNATEQMTAEPSTGTPSSAGQGPATGGVSSDGAGQEPAAGGGSSDGGVTLTSQNDATEQATPFEQSQVIDGVTVTVKAPEGVFPAGAELRVEKTAAQDQAQVEKAVAAVRDQGANVVASHAFDLKVVGADGGELQPADGSKAEVSFSSTQVADPNLAAGVYQVTETQGADGKTFEAHKLDVAKSEDGQTVTVAADGLSRYTVDLTYARLAHELVAGESVALTDVLAAVGLTGEAQAASTSNTELLSASNETGAWSVIASKPFGTAEQLKVTIADVEYRIAVTAREVAAPTEKPAAKADPAQSDPVEGAVTGMMLQTQSNDNEPFGSLQDGKYTLESKTYALTEDFTAEGYIYVPSGVTATINLNGHTLKREIETAVSEGYVISNEGTLTMNGGNGGTITGGNNTSSGGGIYNAAQGSLSLVDCNVINNSCGVRENYLAEVKGGGIYNAGSLTLGGNTVVSGNHAQRTSYGDGIFSEGIVNISGKPVIKDNNGLGGSNLFLKSQSPINVVGHLDEGTSVSVTPESVWTSNDYMGKLTSGLTNVGGGSASMFPQDMSVHGSAEFMLVDGELYYKKEASETVSDWRGLEVAVDLANGGAIIALDGNVSANSGDQPIVVDKNITIDLNGHELNGGQVGDSVFKVTGTGELNVCDGSKDQTGKVTGGNAQKGGAVYVSNGGHFTLQGGTISGNTASQGGAVFVGGEGANGMSVFTMTGGSIKNNEATGQGDDAGQGGGVFAGKDGIINMAGGSVEGNKASTFGGGVFVDTNARIRITGGAVAGNTSTKDGGGIALYGNGTLSGCSVSNNTSTSGQGGGIALMYGIIVMTGGSISNNKATAGGGVHLYKLAHFVAKEGTVISDNKATQGSGGGIRSRGNIELTDATLTGNTAAEHGGAVVLTEEGSSATISGGSITGNTATLTGGGLRVDSSSGTVTLKGTPVIRDNMSKQNKGHNVALDGKTLSIDGTLGVGTQVGVYLMGITGAFTTDYKEHNAGTDPSRFFFADAEGYCVGPNANGEAQVVDSWVDLQTRIDNASSGDVIELAHDVVNLWGHDRLKVRGKKSVTIDLKGHAIDRNLKEADGDGHVIQVQDESTLTIRDTSGKNGKICGGYSKRGGGIYVTQGCTCNIEAGSIQNNNASDDGGGIYVLGTFNMTGGSVTSNYADDTGGGIYVADSGKIDLKNATVGYNTSDDEGAGIMAHMREDSKIENCQIVSNTSKSDFGGGIYLDESDKRLVIKNTHVDGNTSKDDGAGIYVNAGIVEMTGGSVSNNTTNNDAGGVKTTKGTIFAAMGVDISRNTATYEEGGGIKNLGEAVLANCTVSYNTATKEGGGIYSGGDAKLTLEGSTISNNSSKDNGGGVYSDNRLTIKGETTITENTATGFGGGVFVGDDSGDTLIEGKIRIDGNRAVKGANELYLRTHTLKLTGALLEGAKIGITKENDDGIGVFTSSYGANHPSDEPSKYFYSPEGLDVIKNSSGEATLASSWGDLQTRINNTANGGTLQLDRNYTASQANKHLEIKEGKTITIDMNGYTLNRNLADDEGDGEVFRVQKNANLTLMDSNATGNTPGESTITGGYGNDGGGIYVCEGATCTVRNINITKNMADDDGAGIFTRGTLVVENSVISFNEALDCGGGIRSEDTGKVTLTNVTITENTAKGDEGGGLFLYLKSDSSIQNCTITKNHAGDDAGGIYLEAEGKTLTIENTAIDENTSKGDAAGIFVKEGAVVMSGGSVSKNEADGGSGGVKVAEDTTFTATGVTISSNDTGGSPGGGVANYGTTRLTSCTLMHNDGSGKGGGVYSEGNLYLKDCEMIGNKAGNGGGVYSGGYLEMDGTGTGMQIANNKGGGLYVGGSKNPSVTGAIVATDTEGGPDIYLEKGRVLTLNGSIEGTNVGKVDMKLVGDFTKNYSTYHGNTEPSTFFGTAPMDAIPVEWNSNRTEARLHSYWADLQRLIDEAAAAPNKDDRVVTLDRDYTAGGTDKSLTIQEGKDVTIDLNGHRLNRNLTSPAITMGRAMVCYGTLTIKDSSGTESEAGSGIITGGYAGDLYSNDGLDPTSPMKASGGGIANFGTLNFEGGSVAGNTARSSGGGIANFGTLNMTGGLISLNSAEDGGGGIYCKSGNGLMGGLDEPVMTLANVSILSNIAGGHGGGLFLVGIGNSSITQCHINLNSCGDNGGAMRVEAKGKKLTVNSTQIDGNSAVGDGGGIYLNNGTINMDGGSLTGNSTHNDSGAVKVTSNTTFTATNVAIKNNTAFTEEGGGIKNQGSTTLKQCTVTGNKSQKQGGGICNEEALTLKGCVIQNNESSEEGGGVYSEDRLTISDCTIGGTREDNASGQNKAGERGGGVFVDDDSENTVIEGAVNISGNSAKEFGDNLFLCDDNKLLLSGGLITSETTPGGVLLTRVANICVDMEDGTGVLTKNYRKHCGTDNPNQYFTFAEGYDAILNNDGEVELRSGWSTIKREIENATNGATITLQKDYAATDDDDRIVIGGGKSVTVDLNGHILNRNRGEKDDDGHVFEVFGTLTLKDGSADKTGAIKGGWAENGGGVNVSQAGTLNLLGGAITNNRADNGGGVYAYGTFNMSGGSIKGNSAKNGGAACLNANSSSLLTGGNITDNEATSLGGGIKANALAKVSVMGSPSVCGNSAGISGRELHLAANGLIDVPGALNEDAKVGVALADGKDTITRGYASHNTTDPAKYFFSTEGYSVYLENEEAVLGRKVYGETAYTDPFIGANDQINTNMDNLGSQNWMSGISGERYLNEINTPGSHDSGMNNVWEPYNKWAEIVTVVTDGLAFGLAVLLVAIAPFTGGSTLVPAAYLAGFSAALTAVYFSAVPHDYSSIVATLASGRGAEMAKTQKEYINQQLNEGARQLDIRVNNRKRDHVWFEKDEKFNSFVWHDDGKNLWICHGKSGGGTYQAEDPDSEYLSFSEVLTWVKEFLAEHPTETIMLDLRPETEDKSFHRTIYERTRKILEVEALQTNPSTGEPYLYKEEGSDDYFAPYTHMPKLADCRGKIVLLPDSDEYTSYVGGFQKNGFASENLDELEYTNTKQQMLTQVNEEYARANADGQVRLPTTAGDNLDRMWYWETNCTGENAGLSYYLSMDSPHVLAEYVNAGVFGGDNVFSAQNAGNYIGWVRMDSFNGKDAQEVWKTNFFDGLKYCTVTVKSGLEDKDKYPDQTYRLLQGTRITIPGNIYKELDAGKYLGGWATEDNVEYVEGDKLTVKSDITLTAQWLEGKIPVKVVWKDGDNADRLRPESINLNVKAGGNTSTLQLTNNGDWKGVIDATGIAENSITVAPAWDLIGSENDGHGQDAEGQYRYELRTPEGGNGFILTLIHTPQKKIAVSGLVSWKDEDNAEGKRPESVTVHLIKNGEDLGMSQAVTVQADWQYTFGEKDAYENGEAVEYGVAQDPITDGDATIYDTSVEGFTIVNTYVGSRSVVDVTGVVHWNDGGNARGNRPGTVTVKLMANGAEVASQEVSAAGTSLQSWYFKDVPLFDAQGEAIVYSVVASEADGYTVVCEEVEADTSGSVSGQSQTKTMEFLVTYTLQVQESEKTPAEVISAPEPLHSVYNGKAHELVKEGTVSGGTMQYALGNSATVAPEESAFGTQIPSGTELGTYYVWYRVEGDLLHTNTEPVCVRAQIYSPDHEHVLREVAAKGATCTEAGNVTYWVCDQGDYPCGKYYLDAEGTTEASVEDVRVDPLGHDWGAWTVTKEPTDTETGVEQRVCKRDSSHKEERSVPKKDPEAAVYVVLQGADGTWTEPQEKTADAVASYTPGTIEHFTVSGYSTEFLASETGRTAIYTAEAINLQAGKKKLYVYYARNTHDLVFYDDIAGTKVAKTVRVLYGAPLSAYAGEKLEKADHTFAGWSLTPKGTGEYRFEDTIPDDLKSEEVAAAHPYCLYGFGDTMPAATFNLYPVLVADRLEVHLDLGSWDQVAYDKGYTWYDVTKYSANAYKSTPAHMDQLGTDGKPQSRQFTVNLNEGLRMEAMNAATRDGYELAGWFTPSGVRWDSSMGVTPAHCDKDADGNPIKRVYAGEDFWAYTVTLTAAWTPAEIDVRYDKGTYGKDDPASSKTSHGATIDMPAAPDVTDPEYYFTGWQDKNGKLHSAGEHFAFDDWSLTNDGVLEFTAQYAKKVHHLVIFDSAGGSAVAPIDAAEGTEVNAPAESPTKKGYDFDGWYRGDSQVTFPITMGNADVTLTAHWRAKDYTVSFDSQGGSVVPSVTAAYGSDISSRRPENPTKDYFDFAGWQPEYPATMPAENLTLKAKWTPKSCTMTFNANGGSFVGADGSQLGETVTVTGAYDAVLAAPEAPRRDGYGFDGWTLGDSDEVVAVPAHMPGTNPVYKAKWHQHEEDYPVSENVIVATCEAGGSYDVVTYCTICGEQLYRVHKTTKPRGHQWDEGEIGVAPTCEEPGTRVYTCALDASHKRVEEVAPLGHKWGAWAPLVSPTCMVEGKEARHCENDPSHTESRPIRIDPDAHDWGDWEVVKPATVDETGLRRRTCKNNANHSETRLIPKVGHVHALTKVEAKAPTCTEDGNIEHWVCSGGEDPCGLLFSSQTGENELSVAEVVIKATGHAWGEWTVTREATADAEGEERRVCANDATHVETRAIAKVEPEKPVYRNVSGDVTWTRGDDKGATMSFKRNFADETTFDHFAGVAVDGVEVPESGYGKERGSVIVTLTPAYLETLSTGEHTMAASFDDGDPATAKLTVVDGEGSDDGKDSGTNGSDTSGSGTSGSGSGSNGSGNGSGSNGGSGSGASGYTSYGSGTTGSTGSTSGSAASGTRSASPATGDPTIAVVPVALCGAGLVLIGRRRRRR